MIEVIGDLFFYNPKPNKLEITPDNIDELINFKSTHGSVLRCVTTNGIVKASGSLVMGAGVAKEAARRFPELPHLLGQLVDEKGNHVFIIEKFGIASFPTKHDWKNNSDIDLIAQSCRELKWLSKKWDYVILPRVGCGLGGLDWDNQVKPVVETYLDEDKFIVVRSA